MREPTPAELAAVLLRWRKLNPHAPPEAHPEAEESQELLREIRQRAAAIEAETFRMLMQKLRNPPTRSGVYSKHYQFFFFFVIVPLILAMTLLGLLQLLFGL